MPGQCPHCHGLVSLTAGKAYCTNCGWNCWHVAKHLRRMLQVVLWSFCAGLAPDIYWVVQWHDQKVLLLTIVGSAWMVGAVYFVMWRNLRQFLTKTEIVRNRTAELDITQAPTSLTPEIYEQYRELLAMPRPRPVRLSTYAKKTIQGAYIAAGVLAATFVLMSLPYWFIDNLHVTTRTVHNALIFAGLCIVSVAGFSWAKFRGKQLVVNGEIAIAQIIDQYRSKADAAIRYQFIDISGRRCSRFVCDYTGALYEGMTVPVFYNPTHSTSQIAACEAAFEVVLAKVTGSNSEPEMARTISKAKAASQ